MLLPRVLASPQEAFYADKIKVPIREAAGHISGEFVMAYPPEFLYLRRVKKSQTR